MHSVVNQRLKKLGLTPDALPPNQKAWRRFLDQISRMYEVTCQSHDLLKCSLAAKARELQEFRESLAQREERLRSLTIELLWLAEILSEEVPDEQRELADFIRDTGQCLLDTLNAMPTFHDQSGSTKADALTQQPHAKHKNDK